MGEVGRMVRGGLETGLGPEGGVWGGVDSAASGEEWTWRRLRRTQSCLGGVSPGVGARAGGGVLSATCALIGGCGCVDTDSGGGAIADD